MKWLNTLINSDDLKSPVSAKTESENEEPPKSDNGHKQKELENADLSTQNTQHTNDTSQKTASIDTSAPTSTAPTSTAPTSTSSSKPISGSEKEAPASPPPIETRSQELGKQWQQLFILALLNLCVYFTYHGILNDLIHNFGGAYIESINQNYLSQASHDITSLVEILSASKAVLAVLQSSSGGVSFIVDVQVEIGQSISVLFDSIDHAWQFSLIALTSVEIIKLLLGAAKLVTVPIWTALFIFLGFSIVFSDFFPTLGKRLRRLGKSLLIIAATIHFLLPAAVCGTAALNAALYSPQRTHIQDSFTQIHQDLPTANKHNDLSKQIKANMEHVHSHSQYYHQQGKHASHLTTLHIALSFLEYVVSPVLILLGLVMILRRLIGTSQQ